MARSLIHRLKRLESCFRPDYQRPEIVIECVGPNKEVLPASGALFVGDVVLHPIGVAGNLEPVVEIV